MSTSEVNGNGTRSLIHSVPAEVPKPVERSEHVLSTLRNVADVDVWHERSAFENGYRLAVTSGATEPNEAHLAALDENHRAMASAIFREEFDPTLHEADRLRAAEFDKAKEDRLKAEDVEEEAIADVLEQERTEAETSPAGNEPKAAMLLVAAGVAVIALSLTPTLHDSVFSIVPDDMTRWFLSAVTAATFGVLIAFGIVANIDSAGRTATNRWALMGGIVVAVGLALFRFQSAQDSSEIVLCIAQALIEVGAMVLLDAYASALRADHQKYSARYAAKAQAIEKLNAANNHHARCAERLAKINAGIAKHIEAIDERFTRRYHVEENEQALIKAGRDGYFHGISEKQGRRRGVRSMNYDTNNT